MGNNRPGDHVFNKGPMYLWNVELTVQDLGRHTYIVLSNTSEDATELAFKYINSEYVNPVVIQIHMRREMSLVLPFN